MDDKTILTFVGMPGAGKSEAVKYLEEKGVPFVRFGQLTDEGVTALGQPFTEENERMVREKLRKDFGMAAYAIKSEPKINELLGQHDVIAIDGLYSWEEYTYLQKKYSNLILIHVFAEKKKRYDRLTKRFVRPVLPEDCYSRDVAEIEKLNKGGPIAISDYIITNNTDDISNLHNQIDDILKRLGIIQ